MQQSAPHLTANPPSVGVPLGWLFSRKLTELLRGINGIVVVHLQQQACKPIYNVQILTLQMINEALAFALLSSYFFLFLVNYRHKGYVLVINFLGRFMLFLLWSFLVSQTVQAPTNNCNKHNRWKKHNHQYFATFALALWSYQICT